MAYLNPTDACQTNASKRKNTGIAGKINGSISMISGSMGFCQIGRISHQINGLPPNKLLGKWNFV